MIRVMPTKRSSATSHVSCTLESIVSARRRSSAEFLRQTSATLTGHPLSGHPLS